MKTMNTTATTATAQTNQTVFETKKRTYTYKNAASKMNAKTENAFIAASDNAQQAKSTTGARRAVTGRIVRASIKDAVIRATGEIKPVFNAVIREGGIEYKVVYWGDDAQKAARVLKQGAYAEFIGDQLPDESYTRFDGDVQVVRRLGKPSVRLYQNGIPLNLEF